MKRKLQHSFSLLFTILILFASATPAARADGGWTVVSWNGDPVDLTDGWQLCDGTNGSPDLTDRFLVGVGDDYVLGSVGGTITTTLYHRHQVASHTHTISSADLSHTHSVPAHTHSVSSADLSHTHVITSADTSHTHSIASADLSHTHSVPAHTHTISSQNIDHVHTVLAHRHSIAQDSHTHNLEQVSTLTNRAQDRPIGVWSGDGYLHVAPSGAGSETYYIVDDITTDYSHDHDGYTGYSSNVYSGYMDTNASHSHGGATGSWNGTSGAMSANSTHAHGGATGAMSANSTHTHGGGNTGAMSANSTHNHGGATGSWNGTSGAMSANSTHNHSGATGSNSPYTDYQLTTVDLRPPYYAVYYICKAGVITTSAPITASMLLTDPLTTHYYTTTEGVTYSKIYTVSSGEETTNYLLIGLLSLSGLQFIIYVVTEVRKRGSSNV